MSLKGHLFLLQAVFTWSWMILLGPRDVIGSGHPCLRWSVEDDGQVRVTFLQEDTNGVRSLYLSLWSADMRLVACEVNTSPFVTESYATLCDRSESHGQEISLWLNMSIVLDPNAPCARHAPSAPTIPRRSRRDGTEGKARKKRAWIFPGTLWCGKGSEAVRYEQLGMFENADRCCREHDHCLHIIPAFTVKYGVFNPNIYTVSHCDCDERFRQCLLGVNDTISTMVGYSFFNILQIPCFQLKQQRRCTEMYWWGGKGCKKHRKLSTVAPSQMSTVSRTNTTAPSVTTGLLSPSKSATVKTNQKKAGKKMRTRKGPLAYPARSHVPPQVTTDSYLQTPLTTKSTLSLKQKPTLQLHLPTNITAHLCGSLKHLDECKYKIPPLERKYNLQNVESKTAYHCDCTSRLAESKSFKQPSVLPTLLMDFVSQFCFKLPKEKKCHRRKRFLMPILSFMIISNNFWLQQ
uniref:phospholipase A2 n=1 Tax=Mastacembelus armatus TaxID=205130 RepID=A0A3Q3LGA1_9TELE